MNACSLADRTLDPNMAPRLLDEAVNLAKPKSGSAAIRLGGKERLEHLGQDLLAHPAPRIADRDPNERSSQSGHVFDVALVAFHAYEEWANLVVGLWTLISPWALGFSALAAAMWAHVIVGVTVAALAAGSLWFFGDRPLSTA